MNCASIDPRTDPASVKVLLKTGAGVRIEWKDGHRSEYTFDYLRKQCPCATCAVGHEPPPKIISDLPLYQEKVRALKAKPIGQYALHFTFSDGHSTGIYAFPRLREICPCAECSSQRESSSR